MDWFLYDNGLRHERVKRYSIYWGFSFFRVGELLHEKKPIGFFQDMIENKWHTYFGIWINKNTSNFLEIGSIVQT